MGRSQAKASKNPPVGQHYGYSAPKCVLEEVDESASDSEAVDSEDNDMDVDDEASTSSSTTDIRDGLAKALQADFKFDGHFYFAQSFPAAPNPCLNIANLGTIGLPLSTRDAEAITKVAKHAPFGRGTETVVDERVRNTWEIEPSQVRCDNAEWPSFVEGEVKDTAAKALGVAKRGSALKVELYKLLLYEVGSHFLPHQDTEKSNGMFATIIILLPSGYTGGQVHVKRGVEAQVIDMSESSLSTTSVLAWYTDVTHEVKSVTSGYRLALSYNLIYTSESKTIPRPPQMDQAVIRLRELLSKWLTSIPQEETSPNFIAYPLKHQYSNNNLRAGIISLKGQDAHTVSYIRAAGDDLGFVVFLGTLTYLITGEAEDNGHHYSSDQDARYVDFFEIEERELKVEHLVDVEGKLVIGDRSWPLQERYLVPKDYFERSDPDGREYEGYLGNGAGSLSHWYKRTVLILVHKDYAEGILLAAGGIDYVLSRIDLSEAGFLNDSDQKAMVSMVKSLDVDLEEDGDYMRTYNDLLPRAVGWRCPDLWKEVVLKYNASVDTLDEEELASATKVFTFAEMRSCFEELLRRSQLCIFVSSFSKHYACFFERSITEWCQSETLQAFHGFSTPTKQDIPYMISGANIHGITFLSSSVLPQLAEETHIFNFMNKFIWSLRKHQKSLPTRFTVTDALGHQWCNFMDQCLDIAVSQLPAVDAQTRILNPRNSTPLCTDEDTVKPVLLLLKHCVSLQRAVPCRKITDYLLSIEGDPATLFTTIYTPLISSLSQHCRQNKVDAVAPPLDHLLHSLVELYLHRVLGPPPVDVVSKIKKVGCGCKDCNAIDRFILNTQVKQWSIKVSEKAKQTHLENILTPAEGILMITVLPGEPPTLRMNKRPEAISAQKWLARVPEAKRFLALIGNDSAIACLMGSRYLDVQAALKGTRAYAKSKAKGKLKPANSGPSSASGVEASSSAGNKRKRVESFADHGVIDLT